LDENVVEPNNGADDVEVFPASLNLLDVDVVLDSCAEIGVVVK